MVKVVKVKMVIFISGLCHLLTIYKYKIFIIVAVLTLLKLILTKMTMTIMTAPLSVCGLWLEVSEIVYFYVDVKKSLSFIREPQWQCRIFAV